MIRLFLGIPIPVELRSKIAVLSSGIPGAKWVPPENYHITLRFFGEVGEVEYDDIGDAIEQIRQDPFELHLSGLGVFPNKGKPKTLWLHVSESHSLVSLKRKIDLQMKTELKLLDEDRKFNPHLTIARFKEVAVNKLASYLEFNTHFKSRDFLVSQFNLIQSHLTKSGAVYEVLDEFHLGN